MCHDAISVCVFLCFLFTILLFSLLGFPTLFFKRFNSGGGGSLSALFKFGHWGRESLTLVNYYHEGLAISTGPIQCDLRDVNSLIILKYLTLKMVS